MSGVSRVWEKFASPSEKRIMFPHKGRDTSVLIKKCVWSDESCLMQQFDGASVVVL